MAYCLGLDFGGTKLAAGIVDLDSEVLVASARGDTPVLGEAPAAFEAMMALAESLNGIERVEKIGVSFGGHVRRNLIQRSVHVGGWSAFPLVDKLREHIGQLPIQMANDANAVALGEWRFGAGIGTRSLLYVTVSTGIGGGIVVDGSVMEGASGMAGEIGHVAALPNGPQCACGKYGCVEAVASGPAIARHATTLLRENPLTQSKMRVMDELTAKNVSQHASVGDPFAIQALEQAASYLGVAIGNAVNLLDVERVIIGGGVSRSGEVWWSKLAEAAHETILVWNEQLAIKPSGLGENEGIWGAVALVA